MRLKKSNGFTALHFATFQGQLRTLKLLESFGGDLHTQTNQGLTLMHAACQSDQVAPLCYLKQLGIEFDQPDALGMSPLHWAALTGANNCCQYLLAWGANPNSQDVNGFTPLHLNIEESVPKYQESYIVRLLLMNGADPKIADGQQRTPVDLALNLPHSNLQIELLEYMSEPSICKEYCQRGHRSALRKEKQSYALVYIQLVLLVYCHVTIQVLLLQSSPMPEWLVFCTNLFWAANMAFFMIAVLRNPGFIPKDPEIDFYQAVEEVAEAITKRLDTKLPVDATRKQAEPLCLRRLLCPICEVVRNERSRHCPICDRCVTRFDHHCPWINNCVGNHNHGFFVAYLTSSILHLAIVVVTVGIVINRLLSESLDD
jgi:palmitoyltransferase ZDHHC13/17